MKKPVSLVVGVALASMFAADMAEAQTLEEALATAYTNNPTLMARRARTRSVDEGVPQAKGGWRPTVTLQGDIGRSRTSGNVLAPNDHEGQWATPRTGTLTINQPLYRGGRTVAGINQAENNVLAERAALSAVEQDILLNSATAYMNVVRDQAVLELNINNEQVLRRQLEAAQDRFRVGEITRTDVSQAEARLSRAIADRVQSEGNLQASRANFQNVVGILPEKLSPPAGAVTGLPNSLDEAVAQAQQNNPTLLSTEYAARSAMDGIDLVRGELLPQVSLQGQSSRSYGSTFEGGGYGNRDTIVHEATLNVTVPIYQNGQEYARLRAQKHVAGQRRIEVDQARRTTVETVTQAWEALVAAKERGKSYQSQIEASTLALEGVEREAQVGSRTVLDVLNAEQELLDARVNAVRAQRDEAVAAFQLKSAVGRMTAEGMSLPVEVYDPKLHYEEVKDKWIGTGLEPSLPPEAN